MLLAAQALPAILTRTGSAVSGRRPTDMVTRIGDLVRARKRFAAGVGVTTLRAARFAVRADRRADSCARGTAAPPSYRSAIAEPACWGSPLTEKPIGAGQPIDIHPARVAHGSRGAGIDRWAFSFARKPLKRWSAKAGKPHAGRVLFLQSWNCGLDLLANGRRGADLRGGMVDARVA